MNRFTDQHLWNIGFTLFFVLFIALGTTLVTVRGPYSVFSLNIIDLVIIVLASQRLTRLFVYDKVTDWFRELFYDVKVRRGGKVGRQKPRSGARKTIIDLLSCPWCFGMWATATVSFFYITTPYAYYPILILALSSLASMVQLLANLIGHQAEAAKRRNQ